MTPNENELNLTEAELRFRVSGNYVYHSDEEYLADLKALIKVMEERIAFEKNKAVK
ncbi:MAG: hypothetical protein QW575_04445 [Thermoproteota archaeon]